MHTLLFVLFQFFTNSVTDDDCVRSMPEPLIIKKEVTEWSFELDSIERIGIERAKLKNGDQLTLENKGCEYFWVDFEYKFASKSNDSNFKILIKYLELSSKVVNYPFSYKNVFTYFQDFENFDQQEIVLIDEEIREVFILEEISNKTFKFSFTIGPL